MIIVEVVVYRWLMEIIRSAKRSSSQSTLSFAGNTTSIVTEIIDIVLLSLFLQFSKSLLSVRSSGRSDLGNSTRLISQIRSVSLVELFITDISESVGVLSSENIVRGSGLVN